MPASPALQVQDPPPPAPALSPLSHRLLLLCAAAILFLLPAWFFFHQQPVPRVLKATPLTSSSRVDMFGRLRTDGVRLFFLERRGHQWQLSQMPASGGAVQPFPTPFPNAKILAVSPDASEVLLASFTERSEMLALWLMPSVGGTPRRLADVTASDANFTPDGSQITFATDDGIFQIGRDALNLRQLLDLKGAKHGLAWSPDGRQLRFDWIAPSHSGFTIWSVSADGRNLHPLFPNWPEAPVQCCGHFTPDSRYFLFLGYSPDGSRNLYALSEITGFLSPRAVPRRLDTGPLFLDEPVLSPDGHRLFALASDGRAEYVRFDPFTREFHPLLGGESASWLNLSLSLDAAVFRGDGNNLWISRPNGSERRQLVPSSLQPEIPAFRPGSREIVFSATPVGSLIAKICFISADGGAIRDLISESFSVYAPSWSHDGKKLLYSADPADRTHSGLFLLDLDTREKQKVPGSEGYWKARLSPDARWIAAVFDDGKSIGLFDFFSQKWTVVARARVFSPVAWSPDSQSIYFQDLLEDDEPVHRYYLASRKTELAMECRPLLEGGVLRCGFEDFLPDGSFLLQLTRGDHDVYSFDLDLP